MAPWNQVYDPLGSILLSALVASLPVVTMLVALAFLHIQAHVAAIAALVVAFGTAVFVFGMPFGLAARAAGYGVAYGLFPIGWIVLNIIFLYRLTVEHGSFRTLQESIAGITPDRRLQLLLIAFAFGAKCGGRGERGSDEPGGLTPRSSAATPVIDARAAAPRPREPADRKCRRVGRWRAARGVMGLS